jgi:membrane-associated protein
MSVISLTLLGPVQGASGIAKLSQVCRKLYMQWLQQLYSEDGLRTLVGDMGLIVLVIVVFAETGLLAGFFLPGDSLLVTAGIFTVATPEHPALLDFSTTVIVLTLAAIIGNEVGRWLGSRLASAIRQRPDGWLFRQKHLAAAETYYTEKGALSLVLARFIPVLRTFVPFVAGMGKMPKVRFTIWNIIGAILWVPTLLAVGHFIGTTPLADELPKVILVVIAISFLPLIIGAIRNFWKKRNS